MPRAAEDGPRGVADLVNVSSVAGRRAMRDSAVYNATKFAVNAFTESLRQEVTARHVRVSAIEPGAVATELSSHLRDGIREQVQASFDFDRLTSDDIADAIAYVVTRARHVAINEVLIRPTEQVR
jgi:NADP-dependent 3-hydroxy acid dehydrogenase YdfG